LNRFVLVSINIVMQNGTNVKGITLWFKKTQVAELNRFFRFGTV